MLDALPGHVSDMQQSINATEVKEGTVVGKVLDDTRDFLSFLKIFEQLLALGTVFGFNNRTT